MIQATGYAIAKLRIRLIALALAATLELLSCHPNLRDQEKGRFVPSIRGGYMGNIWTKLLYWTITIIAFYLFANSLLKLYRAHIRFVFIPAGAFIMGCSPGDSTCADREKPPHRVEISKPFELGKYEVTQAQWVAVTGMNPSTGLGATRPVYCVSWDEVQIFMKQMNRRNDGYLYRLPTEAEWEYATRAGSIDMHYKDNYSIDAIAWHRDNSWRAGEMSAPHPVGKKRPNAWGLYDMLGNVDEWCMDWYDETHYRNSPMRDPDGPSKGYFKVVRGGEWTDEPRDLTVSRRGWDDPTDKHEYGFRCARERR